MSFAIRRTYFVRYRANEMAFVKSVFDQFVIRTQLLIVRITAIVTQYLSFDFHTKGILSVLKFKG